MNRRGLLAATASLPIASTVQGTSPHQDAVLLAAVEEFVAFVQQDRAAYDGAGLEQQRATSLARIRASARGEPSAEEVFALRIARMAPRTPEGLRAKARALTWFYGGSDDRPAFGFRSTDVLLGSLLADLQNGGAA